MSELNISIIQCDLFWENREENLSHIEGLFEKCSNSDLILLPEMFTTGFSMNAESLAETMDGPTIQWLKSHASNLNSTIAGTIIVKDNSKYYNRLLWVTPSGEVHHYDKRHLFTLAGEDQGFSAGQRRVVVSLKSTKICLNICYDLRFPVWARNQNDYDILVYLANWPKTRSHHWKTLLTARAIENQSFVLACNRTGVDANGLEYIGDSGVISPSGEWLMHSNESNSVLNCKIDLDTLRNYRDKLDFLSDRDNFQIY